MQIDLVEFREFKENIVYTTYEGTDYQYPPLPAPQIKIDGVYYWNRDQIIAYGKSVEQCSLNKLE